MSIVQRVPRSFSFCGGGFSGVYHLGVGQALKDSFPDQIQDQSFQFIGASIGALCSGLMATNVDLHSTKDLFIQVAEQLYQSRNDQLKDVPESEFLQTLPKIRRSFLAFQLSQTIRQVLDQVLPENTLELVNNRTHIVLTKLNRGLSAKRETIVVNQFNSRSDFIDALIASSFIPGYTGQSHTVFRGSTDYIDGGYSDNFPRIDENTVMVSPFVGRFDITPRKEADPYEDEEFNRLNRKCLSLTPFKIRGVALNTQNLGTLLYSAFPPEKRQLENLYDSGYRNALEFFDSLDKKECSWRRWKQERMNHQLA